MVFSIVILALRFAFSASNESGSEDQVGSDSDGRRKKRSPVPNVLIACGLLWSDIVAAAVFAVAVVVLAFAAAAAVFVLVLLFIYFF